MTVPVAIAVALTCTQLESNADREDVYLCGVSLWELLAGRHIDAIEDMPPPTGLRADCPPELDDIVRRATSRDPHGRFATRREMSQTLALAVAPATAEEVAWWAIERNDPNS